MVASRSSKSPADSAATTSTACKAATSGKTAEKGAAVAKGARSKSPDKPRTPAKSAAKVNSVPAKTGQKAEVKDAANDLAVDMKTKCIIDDDLDWSHTVKGRKGTVVPEAGAEGMCRLIINLSRWVLNKDCNNCVTEESTPQMRLASRLQHMGYDVTVEGGLANEHRAGHNFYKGKGRRFDLLVSKGVAKVLVEFKNLSAVPKNVTAQVEQYMSDLRIGENLKIKFGMVINFPKRGNDPEWERLVYEGGYGEKRLPMPEEERYKDFEFLTEHFKACTFQHSVRRIN